MDEKELLIKVLKNEFASILSAFYYESVKGRCDAIVRQRFIGDDEYSLQLIKNYNKAVKKLEEIE